MSKRNQRLLKNENSEKNPSTKIEKTLIKYSKCEKILGIKVGCNATVNKHLDDIIQSVVKRVSREISVFYLEKFI